MVVCRHACTHAHKPVSQESVKSISHSSIIVYLWLNSSEEKEEWKETRGGQIV